MPVTGAYPGSFNPLTVAHLAIAEAARERLHLDRVDLIVSRVPLGKEDMQRPLLDHRLEVLRRAARSRPWLGVVVTDAQLLADIAEGYDVLILGADKWAQVCDASYYGGSPDARDAALARLPRLVVAPRPPFELPRCEVLQVPDALREVSSTTVRSGRREWMAAEAADFDRETGAWSDPSRYEAWVQSVAGRGETASHVYDAWARRTAE